MIFYLLFRLLKCCLFQCYVPCRNLSSVFFFIKKKKRPCFIPVFLVSRTGIEPISTESESIIVSIRPPGHTQRNLLQQFYFKMSISQYYIPDIIMSKIGIIISVIQCIFPKNRNLFQNFYFRRREDSEVSDHIIVCPALPLRAPYHRINPACSRVCIMEGTERIIPVSVQFQRNSMLSCL